MKICNDNCVSYPCSLVQPSGYVCAYDVLFPPCPIEELNNDEEEKECNYGKV